MLNGEFVYTIASLDQGIYPDCVDAAPGDKARLNDFYTLGDNAVLKVGGGTWPPHRDARTADAIVQDQLREGFAMVSCLATI